MAGVLWIQGAEHIEPSAPGGQMDGDHPPRAVWHTVEAPAGSSTSWANMIRVLRSKSAEPQVLYDPITDRLGQFMPLNLSGRALRNDGTTRTNRVGTVCVQVEVMGYAAQPFTNTWKPGPRFRALMAAIRSWGIPDGWPAGRPPRFIANPPHNDPESPRSRTVWLNQTGHYGHSQVPGNDHGDPGGINVAGLFAAAPRPTTTAPTGDDEMVDANTIIGDDPLREGEPMTLGKLAQRVNWMYPSFVDGDGKISVPTLLGRVADKLEVDQSVSS